MNRETNETNAPLVFAASDRTKPVNKTNREFVWIIGISLMVLIFVVLSWYKYRK